MSKLPEMSELLVEFNGNKGWEVMTEILNPTGAQVVDALGDLERCLNDGIEARMTVRPRW